MSVMRIARKIGENKFLDAVTVQNQKESPLLRLPTELRDHIYSFIYASAIAQFVIPGCPTVQSSSVQMDSKLSIGIPALAITCRQVYHEWQSAQVHLKKLFIKGSGRFERLLQAIPKLDRSVSGVQEIELDMSVIWSLQECYAYREYLSYDNKGKVLRFLIDVVPKLTDIVLRLDADRIDLFVDAVRWAFDKRDIQISYRYKLGLVQYDDGTERELLSKKYKLHV